MSELNFLPNDMLSTKLNTQIKVASWFPDSLKGATQNGLINIGILFQIQSSEANCMSFYVIVTVSLYINWTDFTDQANTSDIPELSFSGSKLFKWKISGEGLSLTVILYNGSMGNGDCLLLIMDLLIFSNSISEMTENWITQSADCPPQDFVQLYIWSKIPMLTTIP